MTFQAAPPPEALCGQKYTDVSLTDARTGELVRLSEVWPKGQTMVIDWYGHHCQPCCDLAPKYEALARKHEGKVKVLLVNVVGGGADEAKFAEAVGITHAGRFVCIDPQPAYAVDSIPHVTVIHRSGMVVRNGVAPDLDSLLDAMAAEPPDPEA